MQETLLGKEEDLVLVKKIKTKFCQRSFEKLFSKHSDLYYSVAWYLIRKIKKHRFHYLVDEQFILSSVKSIFYQAVIDYDIVNKKSAFTTYLYNRSFWFLSSYIQKAITSQPNKCYSDSEVLENEDFQLKVREIPDESQVLENYDSKDNVDRLIKVIKSVSDNRFEKIFFARFSDFPDLKRTSWYCVAEKVKEDSGGEIDLSHEGCRLIYNRNIATVKKFREKILKK